MGVVNAPREIAGNLLAAYRDLIRQEARLAERLAPQGMRVGATVTEHMPTIEEFLHLYSGSLGAAGLVVFGGGPDEGSRATGIPFTGATRAREQLGLTARGDSASPSEKAFWEAVARASEMNGGAPIESLFATVHLTHARPYDFAPVHEVKDASARHILRILAETRPQAAVAVGDEALFLLARALGDNRLLDVAAIDEGQWCVRWPPGSRLLDHPYVEVPIDRPFRMRLVPVPSLDGRHAGDAIEALAHLFSYVWVG